MFSTLSTRLASLLAAFTLAAASLPAGAQEPLPIPTGPDAIRLTYGAASRPHTVEPLSGPAQGWHLAGRSGPAERGNYFGFEIKLAEPIDLRNNSLQLDAKTDAPGTAAFYVRAYNRGEKEPAWSFNSWNSLLKAEPRTFRFQRQLCPDGLAWEAETVGDRVATAIDRIEIVVGTRQPETDVDVTVTNLRVAPMLRTIADIDKVKPVIDRTALVTAGAPAAVILHPDTAAGAAAAARIAAAIAGRTGASLPARPGSLDDALPGQTAIMVGTVNSNPALQVIYARGLTPVDAICPGTAGALVHTVFDPFGKRVNIVVAGASDDAGLDKATALLVAAIEREPAGRDLSLPRLFERAYGADFLRQNSWAAGDPAPDRLEKGLAEGQQALDRGNHTSVAGVLSGVANRYRLTGHAVEAQLYVKLFEMYAKSAVADPRKFGGAWGFDSDFPSRNVFAGWDLIEDDPSLTDEQRLATLKIVCRWIKEAALPEATTGARSPRLPQNHMTFAAHGVLAAGLYLTQHYDVLEGPEWLGTADSLFRRQATYYKPTCDCNTYQWITNGHIFSYAMIRPDRTVFDNGNAKRITDYCLATMDNLGLQVPYGDTGSWNAGGSEMPVLDMMAYTTGDPVALWTANHKRRTGRSRANAGSFVQRGDPPMPTGFDGVKTWPLEPHWLFSYPVDNAPPLEKMFDKISFREKMDPQALYFLLDGLGNGSHGHEDGNSVLRLTQFDRIWLADNDYFKAPLKYHNSVLVIRDGRSDKIPPYSELIGVGENDRFGYSISKVSGYAGADWERTLVWLKEQKALVVLDRLTAREAGQFQFRTLWHGVGKPTMTEDGMRLEQKGPDMWIQVARGPKLSLFNDEELGTNWKGYNHADPVVRSLSAIADVELKQGESYTFVSAFHGSASGRTEAWKLDRTDDLLGAVIEAGGKRFALRPAAGGVIELADAAGARLAPPAKNLAAAAAAPAHPVVRDLTAAVAGSSVTAVTNARILKGQPPAILVGTAEGKLTAFGADGSPIWSREFGARLNDVAPVDLDNDGIDELMLARHDHFVTVLKADSTTLWEHELPYYRRNAIVTLVRQGDLDGDGRPEVIAGAENWRFYAYKADGTELWNYEAVHPSRSGVVADLDGDGKAEVACGTHYYSMTVLGQDGTRRWAGRFGPICWDLDAGRWDGGKTRGLIAGSGNGNIYIFDSEGKEQLDFPTGDEVTTVAAADLDGDGRDEALAGSYSHSVYCFDGAGKQLWRRALGSPVTRIEAVRRGSGSVVIAGTSEGRVVTLDAQGRVIAESTLGGPVTHLATIGDNIMAASANGKLVRLNPIPAAR